MIRQDAHARLGWRLTLQAQRKIKSGLLLILAVAFLMPTVFYIYWLVSNALKPNGQINQYPPVIIPYSLTLEHLVGFYEKSNIPRLALNSLIISGATTLLGLFFSVPAAYGLVKLKRQATWGMAILATRMLPGLLALIGWYRLFAVVDMLDTYSAIILTHLIYAVPLMTWILVGYFEDMDPDLESAALIDGCSRFQAFRLVGVPLVLPGITVAAILVFVASWNDFIRGLLFAGPDKRPLVMAVFKSIQLEYIYWGEMMAAAFFVLVPVLLVTVLLQKYIVAGLTTGAIK